MPRTNRLFEYDDGDYHFVLEQHPVNKLQFKPIKGLNTKAKTHMRIIDNPVFGLWTIIYIKPLGTRKDYSVRVALNKPCI